MAEPRSGRKSASAFRTISEASEILEVPQHVLRFWETRFSILKPMKRGGRRYYRPEDIQLLTRIKSLLYDEGYTIKGAQKHLRDQRSSKSSSDSAAIVEAPPPREVADEAKSQQATADRSPAAGEGDSLEKVLDELVDLRDFVRTTLKKSQ